jgi:hypothetical protein
MMMGTHDGRRFRRPSSLLHARSPAQQDQLGPSLGATGRSLYVLPLLFDVAAFVFTLGIRAGAIALPFFSLHRARLIRARLPWVIRVETHILSVLFFEEERPRAPGNLRRCNPHLYQPDGRNPI